MKKISHPMYKMTVLLGLMLVNFAAISQPKVVRWDFQTEKVNENTFDVVLTATLQPGWYMYSQHLDEGGPIPTSLSFEEGSHYQLEGSSLEKGARRMEGHDELFGMNVTKYAGEVVFTQRVRVSDRAKPIRGSVEYMTCNDEQCLPPRSEPFEVRLPKL